MTFKHEAFIFGHGMLTLFDFGIGEFNHLATRCANEVIVVIAIVQFENGLATIELAAHENTGLLELGKHTINRCQTDIDVFGDQCAIDVFRALMTLIGTPEDIKYLETGERGLEAHVLEFSLIIHGENSLVAAWVVHAPPDGTQREHCRNNRQRGFRTRR